MPMDTSGKWFTFENNIGYYLFSTGRYLCRLRFLMEITDLSVY